MTNEEVVVYLARELYDKFVMGGALPRDVYDLIRDALDSFTPEKALSDADRLAEACVKEMQTNLVANVRADKARRAEKCCDHPRSSHFDSAMGSFCKECPDQDFISEHTYKNRNED